MAISFPCPIPFSGAGAFSPPLASSNASWDCPNLPLSRIPETQTNTALAFSSQPVPCTQSPPGTGSALYPLLPSERPWHNLDKGART